MSRRCDSAKRFWRLMMCRKNPWAYLTMLLAVAGCAAPPKDAAWPPRRPLGGDIAAYVPPQKPPADPTPPEFQEPTGVVDLRTAWSAALMRNPQLRAFSWEVRAAEARVLQASLPPNPDLEVEIEELRTSRGAGETSRKVTLGPEGFEVEQETEEGPGSGFGSAEYVIGLSQVIELGGKRPKRTAVAALERDLAGWDYETRRVSVLTEVAKAFVDVLAAQERVALTGKLVELSETLLTTVDERLRAGKETPLEQTKARVALATRRIEAEQADRRLNAARKRLAALWDGQTAEFEKVEAVFDRVRPIPAVEELADLIDQNPEIARWAAEMAHRQAQVELAKARRIGDLTVAGGIQHFAEEDDTAIVLGFSLPLPLFDRNQGGIAEAAFAAAKAAEERRAARVQVQAALTETYQELASALSQVTGLRESVLPAASEAFEAAAEGYRAGKFTYLDVLDAQRTYFEGQGQYIDALEAYHKAVADIEQLIGQSLASVGRRQETTTQETDHEQPK